MFVKGMYRPAKASFRRLMGWLVAVSIVAFSPAVFADGDSGAQSDARSGQAEVTLAQGQGLQIQSADESYSLSARGIFQGHYLFETIDDSPEHGSFFLRFVRTDIQGHALTPDLTFRLMPEFATSPSLLDGWVSYRFMEGLQLRAGQFNIPFNWERHAPPTRHQFGQRSMANQVFEWPGGRDIGLMFHGDPTDWLRYGVGVFGGQGRNVVRSDTLGHLASGRIVVTPLGDYATSEVLVEPAEEPNLSIGAGAFLTGENTARDWEPTQDAERVLSTTADVTFRWSRISAYLSGFHREVRRPFAAETDPFPFGDEIRGVGYTAAAGVLAVPRRLFVVGRYSEAYPDIAATDRFRREIRGGTHLFHRGLDSRLAIEAGVLFRGTPLDDVARDFHAGINYQFLY